MPVGVWRLHCRRTPGVAAALPTPGVWLLHCRRTPGVWRLYCRRQACGCCIADARRVALHCRRQCVWLHCRRLCVAALPTAVYVAAASPTPGVWLCIADGSQGRAFFFSSITRSSYYLLEEGCVRGVAAVYSSSKAICLEAFFFIVGLILRTTPNQRVMLMPPKR